jgi:hypothetical protein
MAVCNSACGGGRLRPTAGLMRTGGIKDDYDGRSCDCLRSALLKTSISRSHEFRMFRTGIVGD